MNNIFVPKLHPLLFVHATTLTFSVSFTMNSDPCQLPSTSKSKGTLSNVTTEAETDTTNTAPAADTASNKKKKAPPFLQREVKVRSHVF